MNRESSTEQRRALRRRMRGLRRRLGLKEREQTAQAIARHVARMGWLKPGARLALYLATPEEISCLPLIERALRHRCTLYLPKIDSYRAHRMFFAAIGSRYRRNRFGIPEPSDRRTRIQIRQLQKVFVPLVAFDTEGHRLGMGGGYYDRALQRRRQHPHSRQPRIIGIAHSCQRVDALPIWPTDVPLDAVVTERGVEVFKNTAR